MNTILHISIIALSFACLCFGRDDLRCYSCTSYMSQCKGKVDNRNGDVSIVKCNSKCFLRLGEDKALYRGCFDGFKGVQTLNYDYVGCQLQNWNGKALPWCLCEDNLCNGNSSLTLRNLGENNVAANGENDVNYDDQRFDDDVNSQQYEENDPYENKANNYVMRTTPGFPAFSTHADYTVTKGPATTPTTAYRLTTRATTRRPIYTTTRRNVNRDYYQNFVNCYETGFYKHPLDCNRFVACIVNVHTKSIIKYQMRCPSHLVWDDTEKLCLEWSTTCSF